MSDDILKTLFAAEKAVVGRPTWQQSDSTWFRFACLLEIAGATPEGPELRGKALQTVPDRGRDIRSISGIVIRKEALGVEMGDLFLVWLTNRQVGTCYKTRSSLRGTAQK